MADPRLQTGYDEEDAHFISIPVDNSITLPTMGTLGWTQSTNIGQAVTNVATGTGAPTVGLGSDGDRLFGRIKQVDLDGTATVQDRGYMLLAYDTTGGQVPVPGTDVAVGGDGTIEVGGATLGSVCEGFVTDPATGSLACVVKKF